MVGGLAVGTAVSSSPAVHLQAAALAAAVCRLKRESRQRSWYIAKLRLGARCSRSQPGTKEAGHHACQPVPGSPQFRRRRLRWKLRDG